MRTLSLLASSVSDQSLCFLDGYSWEVFRWGKGLDTLAFGRSKEGLGWLFDSFPTWFLSIAKKVLLTRYNLLKCDFVYRDFVSDW